MSQNRMTTYSVHWLVCNLHERKRTDYHTSVPTKVLKSYFPGTGQCWSVCGHPLIGNFQPTFFFFFWCVCVVDFISFKGTYISLAGYQSHTIQNAGYFIHPITGNDSVNNTPTDTRGFAVVRCSSVCLTPSSLPRGIWRGTKFRGWGVNGGVTLTGG